jgi:YD repeat-containing protein
MSTEGRVRRARASVAGVVAASLLAGACTSGGSGPAGEIAAAQVTVVSPPSCAEVGCVGEGIDTSTGAFQLAIEDLLLAPGLFGIELVRNYRSDVERLGWFGRGWSTVYETTITEDGDGVTIDAPAGLAPLWAPEAPAGWDVAGSPTVARVDDGYSLTWPTGEQWRFKAAGGLESLTSPYGATVTVERTSDTIALSSSQGLVLTANLTNERVASVETNDGRQVDYVYADDLLVGVNAPGIDLAYRYDAGGHMIESAAPSGTTTVAYADGTVTNHRTATGQRFALTYDGAATTVASIGPDATFEHDADARLVRVTVGDDDILLQSFDADGRLLLRTEYALPGGEVVASVERTYESGRLTAETLDGVTTEYTYDDRGRITGIVGPAAATFDYDDDAPLPTAVTTPTTGRTEFLYSEGFVTSVTDATGTTTLTSRDELGNSIGTGPTIDALWAYEFDAEGNITSTTSPSGRTWVSEWGPRAVLRRERDPVGRTTSYAYDAAGRLARETRADGTTTERTYNSNGGLATMVGPDGLATRYEYDPNGRVHTIVEPGDRTWRVSYDDRLDGSQTVTATAPDGTSTVARLDSSGREMVRRVLDSAGTAVESTTNSYEFDRLTKSTLQRGPSTLVTTTTHDDAGRVIGLETTLDGVVTRADRYEYQDGRIVAVHSMDESATYGYDAAGGLVQVTSGEDTWAATYRGGQIAVTRHNDETTEIERDADGRPVRFVDGDGVTTEWRYDDVDRPLTRSVSDAVAGFEWDAADRLTVYRAPTGAVWTWTYDAAGRLTGATEPGEVTTTYEYELGAVTRVRTSGGGRDRDDKYAYDALGRLRDARTGAGWFQYVYDAAGRVVEIDGPRGNDDETWTVNAAGQVTTVTSGDRAYTLTYTGTGQLDALEGPDDEFLDAVWNGSNLTAVEVDGHDPLGLAIDPQGRLASVAWDSDSIVDLTWRDTESFRVQQRGSDDAVAYTVTNGFLTAFEREEVAYSATGSAGGSIETLALDSADLEGVIRFDAVGRPAVLQTSDRTSTLTYDSSGRVSSVLTTRPGEEPEQTTVSYDDGRKVDGDDDLVNALFDQTGGLKQSLPNSLPNPLAAGAAATSLQQALLIEGAEAFLVAEPDPFTQVESAISASSPQLTAPIGVRDRLRLARQLVVAEATRLAPTVSLGDGLTVQVPIINPENGELADFNPFVDATPSGLALGIVARQAGGGGSLLNRAVDHLGDIAGGVLAFSKDVASFVTTNPIARLVLNVAALAVPIACAFVGPACVSPGAIIIGAVAVINFVGAVQDVANSCPAGETTRCGIGIALAALSVVEFAFARQIAGAFVASRPAAVNGRPPINASYAGRSYDGPGWSPAMQDKYPAGVPFDRSGFARFERYSVASVRSDGLTGEYALDAAIANRAVGLTRTPPGYVWHHVEDGRTLVLIPQDIHSAVRHTGGAAVLRGSLTSGT